MAFNADTYAHDVLRMLGFNNIFASAGERYPTTTLAEAIDRKPDIVLLPDEPYEFNRSDIAELKKILPSGSPPRDAGQRPRPSLVRRPYGERAEDAGREPGALARLAGLIALLNDAGGAATKINGRSEGTRFSARQPRSF